MVRIRFVPLQERIIIAIDPTYTFQNLVKHTA